MVSKRRYASHTQGGFKLEKACESCQTQHQQFHFCSWTHHTPRFEKQDDLTILCQGATGLSFDGDTRGAVAFLTVGDTFEWDVIRYTYDHTATIKDLEKRKPPFYENLMKTVRYAAIRNDL